MEKDKAPSGFSSQILNIFLKLYVKLLLFIYKLLSISIKKLSIIKSMWPTLLKNIYIILIKNKYIFIYIKISFTWNSITIRNYIYYRIVWRFQLYVSFKKVHFYIKKNGWLKIIIKHVDELVHNCFILINGL